MKKTHFLPATSIVTAYIFSYEKESKSTWLFTIIKKMEFDTDIYFAVSIISLNQFRAAATRNSLKVLFSGFIKLWIQESCMTCRGYKVSWVTSLLVCEPAVKNAITIHSGRLRSWRTLTFAKHKGRFFKEVYAVNNIGELSNYIPSVDFRNLPCGTKTYAVFLTLPFY